MTSRLKKQIGLLNQIRKAKPKLQKAIIQNANRETLNCLCDCAWNVLQKNIPLSSGQKRKLARYKKELRYIGTKGGSLKKKQQLLVQKGGIVSAILTPILLAALPLLAEWMAKP